MAGFGVWRSLVARSVRVGEVPSSNLGTPISSLSPTRTQLRGERTLAPRSEAFLVEDIVVHAHALADRVALVAGVVGECLHETQLSVERP